MTAPPLDLDHVIDTAQIIVCCGSGGVGKTTTAAALALRAAERGRKTVVLTIDPARRLAQAMGLSELDNTPRPVKGIDGDLDAMMLDMKRTFDEIVATHAEPAKAKQILDNPFYQALSSSFAGTQEYMAMEKLGQLKATGDYDLIVVDTPPQPLRARLPRRTRAADDVPRRAAGEGAARTGEGGWQGLPQGRHRRASTCSPVRSPGSSARRCCRTCRSSSRRWRRCSAGSASGRRRPTTC